MARYTADNEDHHLIAELELDGWSEPEYWDGSTQVPEGFPWAAMDALTVLFTGKRPLDGGTEGIEIPDILGWHIATLIEAWGGHLLGFLQEYDDCKRDREALLIRAAALLDGRPQHEAEKVRELEFGEMQARRTEAIIRHTQQWYSDGLTLYQIYRDKQG